LRENSNTEERRETKRGLKREKVGLWAIRKVKEGLRGEQVGTFKPARKETYIEIRALFGGQKRGKDRLK